MDLSSRLQPVLSIARETASNVDSSAFGRLGSGSGWRVSTQGL